MDVEPLDHICPALQQKVLRGTEQNPGAQRNPPSENLRLNLLQLEKLPDSSLLEHATAQGPRLQDYCISNTLSRFRGHASGVTLQGSRFRGHASGSRFRVTLQASRL
ncbi:hypothetical protein EYF80_059530 [Liparis tanakae]|uniref:Uncharacterized protein n=1 Tax=Liparis tanakae TaxID=230148 RepID=A0A4Z2EN03_9TELE|nr:hypothetical protein EYF80_059530 [Liparis tanakae]